MMSETVSHLEKYTILVVGVVGLKSNYKIILVHN